MSVESLLKYLISNWTIVRVAKTKKIANSLSPRTYVKEKQTRSSDCFSLNSPNLHCSSVPKQEVWTFYFCNFITSFIDFYILEMHACIAVLFDNVVIRFCKYKISTWPKKNFWEPSDQIKRLEEENPIFWISIQLN